MTELVFSTQRRNFEKGRHYQNPAYFEGRFPQGTSHVYVLGDWPKVIDAAEEAGINYTQLVEGAPISWKDGVAPAEPGQGLVEIASTWRQFGNQRIIELATAIAQRDVANRKQAVRIIEDELDRRNPNSEEDETNSPDEVDSPSDEPEIPDSGKAESDDDPKEVVPAKKSSRRNRRK